MWRVKTLLKSAVISVVSVLAVAGQQFVYVSDVDYLLAPTYAYFDKVVYTPEGGSLTETSLQIAQKTYQKGLYAHCRWNSATFFQYATNYRYNRLTAEAGISHVVPDAWFEWCCVHPDEVSYPFSCLCRPPSFGASEDHTYIRVGAGASVHVHGKIGGAWIILYRSPEFYSWSSAPVMIDVDISECSEVRIRFVPDHTEQSGAPYRKSSPLTPVSVGGVPWNDHVVLGDAKFHINPLATGAKTMYSDPGASRSKGGRYVSGMDARGTRSEAEKIVTIHGRQVEAGELRNKNVSLMILLRYRPALWSNNGSSEK